jgi:hypothetical protein
MTVYFDEAAREMESFDIRSVEGDMCRGSFPPVGERLGAGVGSQALGVGLVWLALWWPPVFSR